MKKVLVSGYIGFNNFGDEAIFKLLSSYLKSLGVDVSVLCGNVSKVEKNYAVKAYYYKNPIDIIKALFNCNILISGGGSLLQNKTSNFSLFYYLSILLFAKILRKKTFIFAQGFEPIKGDFQTLITKTILKTVDFITVRDKKSVEILALYGIKAELVSDPVYSLAENTNISKEKSGLIVQLRNFHNINPDFTKRLAFIISKNYKDKISVFSFQNEYDEKICLNFIDELKKYNINADYISNKTIDETLDIINKAKYIISMRLHGLILGASVQTQTFALKYDDKINTLCEELNIENIDIYNFKDDELQNKLDKFFKETKTQYNYRKFSWDFVQKFIGA